MKKHVLGAVMATAMVFSVGAFAQDQQQSATSGQATGQSQQQGKMGHKGHGKEGKMDPEARLDRMSQKLNLTDDQKAKIKPILEQESQQMKSLKADTSTQKADKRAKAQEIRKSTMEQIRPILNSDQQAKLDQMHKNMQAHAGKHQGGKKGAAASSTQPQS